MTLNEKIINLLKEHPEGGEKFFDALDLLIRSDRAILDDFITWAIAHTNTFFKDWSNQTQNPQHIGLVLTGKFGNAVISNYLNSLSTNFTDIVLVNGGIREGAIPEIYRQDFGAENFVLFDDSFYSGTTMLSIEKAMQAVDEDINIVHACVIYDGSRDINELVSSLYKYYN